MICLGIESSCDETALAVVQDGRLLASTLATQVEMHALFGGVVPELASREHYRFMGPLYDTVLQKAEISPQDVDVYAVSRGPGLLGALLVGVGFAKGLALASNKPVLGINHLHAHLLAVGLEQELRFPALGVLVSGGHTHLYKIRSADDFEVLGRTLDDAAGEAFDKVGKVLGLAYPAGRVFDALSQRGYECITAADKKLFPRPYLGNDTLDFSFSGLKTAATQYIAKHPDLATSLKDIPMADTAKVDAVMGCASHELCRMCAAFTEAVVDTLCLKSAKALQKHPDIKSIIMAGGVAANSHLRKGMQKLAEKKALQLLVPSPALCTDNAAMVAYCGWLYGQKGLYHPLDFESFARGQVVPENWLGAEQG